MQISRAAVAELKLHDFLTQTEGPRGLGPGRSIGMGGDPIGRTRWCHKSGQDQQIAIDAFFFCQVPNRCSDVV